LEPYKVTDVIENAFSFFNCKAENNRKWLAFTFWENRKSSPEMVNDCFSERTIFSKGILYYFV
jgi:hypothetical protein